LGIPLFDRQNLIGVMAIQTIQPRIFSEVETSTLSTIAFQLSSVVASTRLLEQLDLEAGLAVDVQEVSEAAEKPVPLVTAKFGFGTVAIGPAILIDNAFGVSDVCDNIAKDPAVELQNLESAFAAARVETLCLEKKIAQRLDEADAAIFHSHLGVPRMSKTWDDVCCPIFAVTLAIDHFIFRILSSSLPTN
jgi:phosphotransferase system enzyme I (PtsP)